MDALKRLNAPPLVIAGLLFLVFFLVSRSTGETAAEVDLVLVLAMDVSSSVDAEEFALQRDGLAKAISVPEVLSAIRKGAQGQIALSVVQWSGFTEQSTSIDWTLIGTQDDIAGFAARVSAMTRRYDGGATDIEGALQFTRKHALSVPFSSSRIVVDISGDGKSNVNASPGPERDKSVAAGITVNGLAIASKVGTLTEYYRQNVIGGHNSFVETAKSYGDFERAIRRKLLREIGTPFLS